MIDVEIKNSDNSNGLKRGTHYLPFVSMSDLAMIGLSKKSDGTSDAQGTLYPTGLNNNTEVGQVNTFITTNMPSLTTPQGLDDGMYTNNQTKFKVGESWFAKYKSLISVKMIAALKPRQLAWSTGLDSSSGPFKAIELDSTRILVLYKQASSGISCRVVKRDANNNIIDIGTNVAFSTSNSGSSTDDVDACLIGTDKVAIISSLNGEAGVCSISDMTITMGTAVQYSANGVSFCTVSKIDTDKAIISYRENSGTSYVRILSASGTTTSYGTAASLGSSLASPIVAGNTTTTAFVIYVDSNGSGNQQGRTISISGTTITLNTAAQIGANAETCLHRMWFVQLATDKFLMLTDGTATSATRKKALIISVSGTSFTTTSNTLTTAFQQYNRGSLIEITTNTTFYLYQNDGSGNTYVRQINISGTAVTDAAVQTLTTDSNYLYATWMTKWGSDIFIVSLKGSSFSEMNVYIASTGVNTFELYNNATLIASYSDTFSYAEKTYAIGSAINSKKMYLGIKNKSGANRYFSLINLMTEVK